MTPKNEIQRQRPEAKKKPETDQEKLLNEENKVLTESEKALKELEKQAAIDTAKEEAKGLKSLVEESVSKEGVGVESFEGSTRSEMKAKEGFTTNVQTLLNEYVNMEEYGGIDGYYGPKTKEAVKKLQNMINEKLPEGEVPLSDDGYFGPLTLEAYKKVKDKLTKRLTEEDKTEEDKTEEDKTEEDKTEEDKTEEELKDTNDDKKNVVETQEVMTKKISLSEAQKMAKRELTPEEKNTVFRIEGTNQPIYNFGETKKYFFLQGSATNDEVLLAGGSRDRAYPYAITKNGLIVEFYDPTLGTAGVNDRASYNGDPFANARGMSVEFSAKEISIKRKDGVSMNDTEEPNNNQIEAFIKTLRPYIRKTYPTIESIGTSAEVAFGDDGLPAWSNAHGDTYAWSKDVLTKLGVTLKGRGEPTQDDIKAYIAKLDEVIANPAFTGDDKKKKMLQESREFWEKKLDKK